MKSRKKFLGVKVYERAEFFIIVGEDILGVPKVYGNSSAREHSQLVVDPVFLYGFLCDYYDAGIAVEGVLYFDLVVISSQKEVSVAKRMHIPSEHCVSQRKEIFVVIERGVRDKNAVKFLFLFFKRTNVKIEVSAFFLVEVYF